MNHIKTNWADSKLLSDKQLTYKVTILLAFTSASRASTIHHLDTRFMTRTDNRYQFTFHKLHKSWRRGKPPPTIEFYGFKEDKELCIVTTLDEYLNRTRTWHNNESKTQLLLSHVKPHAEVTSSTVSRWLKHVLKEAGINVDIYKGHSTRAASSIKAALVGLSISDILKRGSWCNESTWQKFYNKPIVSPEERFQNIVLSNSVWRCELRMTDWVPV